MTRKVPSAYSVERRDVFRCVAQLLDSALVSGDAWLYGTHDKPQPWHAIPRREKAVRALRNELERRADEWKPKGSRR